MPGPYFPNSSWTAFVYRGAPYSLDHLNEYEFTAVDTDKIARKIAVTFADHCFTRDPQPGDDPALVYPASDRHPGHFCFERYQLSIGLVGHIAFAAAGKVWTVDGGNFAALSVIDQSGRTVFYGIVFSLDRVSGLPVDLHMRVKTAYPMDDGITTFGSVRFRHLVALRMKNRRPGRIAGERRRVPRV
jgi:hypothetical protein